RRKSQATGLLGAVAREIKTLQGKPYDVTPDSLRVVLTIKTDGRSKHLALGEKEIEELAIDVINNTEPDDDYVIITGTGQKITPKEIFMKTTALIEADGKTVDRDQAWHQLLSFYNQLRDNG